MSSSSSRRTNTEHPKKGMMTITIPTATTTTKRIGTDDVKNYALDVFVRAF